MLKAHLEPNGERRPAKRLVPLIVTECAYGCLILERSLAWGIQAITFAANCAAATRYSREFCLYSCLLGHFS
jgi:hypothetical protein